MCKFKIRTLVFIFTILILLNIYSTSKLFEFSSKFRQNFIKFGNCTGVAIVIQNMNFFLSKMTIFRFEFGYFDIENGEFKVPEKPKICGNRIGRVLESIQALENIHF